MNRDVLIIGGGVIGLCTAYYAAERGHRVTVVDQGAARAEGCSFGNAGMVVPSHFVPLAAPGMVALGLKWMWNPRSPFYVKPRLDWDLWRWGWRFARSATRAHVARSAPLLRDLHLASRACFEALAAVPGLEFGLVRKGLLMLCKTEHALEEEARAAEQARRLGIPAEMLDAEETAALEPGVRMDIAGSAYFPQDCHLLPHELMSGLRRHLANDGVRFAWETRVTGWSVESGRLAGARTDRGEFKADDYVLCGGAWSAELGRMLGLAIPLEAGKGYSLTLARPRQLPQICAILAEARVAVTPMGSSLRFGGTLELAGLNEDINPARVQGIIDAIPRYYPEFQQADFEGIRPWCGLRPCSPDGLPYVGRTKRYPNLTVATGHAMMGVSLGPITGRIVAGMLSAERPDFDLEPLSPDRFGR